MSHPYASFSVMEKMLPTRDTLPSKDDSNTSSIPPSATLAATGFSGSCKRTFALVMDRGQAGMLLSLSPSRSCKRTFALVYPDRFAETEQRSNGSSVLLPSVWREKRLHRKRGNVAADNEPVHACLPGTPPHTISRGNVAADNKPVHAHATRQASFIGSRKV